MGARTEARNFGANAGFSTPRRSCEEVRVTADQANQRKISEVISALRRQLATSASGAPKAAAPAHRVTYHVRAFCCNETIGPSTHQRVAIENHREDWP